MARLYLIRHGRAAAGFGSHPDPGLDDVGRRQAQAIARDLDPVGPLDVVTSPLQRARETAAPLEDAWGVTALVEDRVAEIPSPTDDLAERVSWLRGALAARWGDLDGLHRDWREALVEYLLTLSVDTVVVTHFVAINAVVGHARSDDAVVQEVLANCSCTVVEQAPGGFVVVEMGRTERTDVR